MPKLYYALSSAEGAGETTFPTVNDTGFIFLQYYKQTTEENLERLRGCMIRTSPTTYNLIQGFYHEDGTYTDTQEITGIVQTSWESDFKAFAGLSYVVSCVQADYDQLRDAMGL